MAKIRPYIEENIYDVILVELHHLWEDDPYEPHAYHTIYPYRFEDLPPWADAYQSALRLEEGTEDLDLVFARGIIMAHGWAAMPAMMMDICLACRFHDYGPALPRWNIYRGEERLRYYPDVQDYPSRVIPCFVQKWDDPAPPGFE